MNIDYDNPEMPVQGTVVGAHDPGLRDPHTGDRMRVVHFAMLEDDAVDLAFDDVVLMTRIGTKVHTSEPEGTE